MPTYHDEKRTTGWALVLTVKDKEATMKRKQLEKQANRIADAIIDLVERTDGPVTLAEVDREIPGFAEKNHPTKWEYLVEHDDGETVIWAGMTEAGFEALREVISGRRVAVQYVSPMLYFIEGCYPRSENWMPVVLLPARAANLDTPNGLVRRSQGYLDYCMTRAEKEGVQGYRLLTPSTVRCTADQFAVM
jgi:hypothetical protein